MPAHDITHPALSGRSREDAQARLLSLWNRLTRLEAMARDRATVSRLLSQGRYLRLAAAIATASFLVEEARLNASIA